MHELGDNIAVQQLQPAPESSVVEHITRTSAQLNRITRENIDPITSDVMATRTLKKGVATKIALTTSGENPRTPVDLLGARRIAPRKRDPIS